MNNSRKLILLTGITVILLWVSARLPVWNNHSQVDIWVMWERINYFFTHNYSFAGLTGNEILPATLMYLFIPVALVPSGALSWANYLPIMMMVNAATVAGHWFFMKNKQVFLTALIFLGPLLFFRFDALVTLLMVGSFYAFTQERYGLSGFALGLSTGMKVFPVIFLPYLVMILWRTKDYANLKRMLIYFGEALIVPVLMFFLLGGSFEQIKLALDFHSQKLISIESIPGSLITGWETIKNGVPPQMIPGNGIWAVAGPSNLLNRIWVIPVAVMYLLLWYKNKFSDKFSYLVPFVLLLIFSVFSKNLNPQYMWWFLAILPMINPSKTMWIVALISALLNQLVFPLFYTTFTVDFFQNNTAYWIYYCLLLRNIGIVYMMILGIKEIFGSESTK